MNQGVNLPQVALLGQALKDRGLNIKKIPVTEKQAIEVFSEALKERGIKIWVMLF